MTRRRVAVITGSRAEFGLLRPVMRAIDNLPTLELLIIPSGAHLVSPALTYREIKREFGPRIADAFPMQVAGRTAADRILRMGERPESIRLVRSPAIDRLAAIPPLKDTTEFGSPSIIFLMHPIGRPAEHEESAAAAALDAALSDPSFRLLALHPNL